MDSSERTGYVRCDDAQRAASRTAGTDADPSFARGRNRTRRLDGNASSAAAHSLDPGHAARHRRNRDRQRTSGSRPSVDPVTFRRGHGSGCAHRHRTGAAINRHNAAALRPHIFCGDGNPSSAGIVERADPVATGGRNRAIDVDGNRSAAIVARSDSCDGTPNLHAVGGLRERNAADSAGLREGERGSGGVDGRFGIQGDVQRVAAACVKRLCRAYPVASAAYERPAAPAFPALAHFQDAFVGEEPNQVEPLVRVIELQPVSDCSEVRDIGRERARRSVAVHRDHTTDSLRPVGAAAALPEASDSIDDNRGRAGRTSGNCQAVRSAIDKIRVEGDSSASSKVAGESHCIGDVRVGPDIKSAGHAQGSGRQRVRARSEGNLRASANADRFPASHACTFKRTRYAVERKGVGDAVAAVKRRQAANVRAEEGQASRISRQGERSADRSPAFHNDALPAFETLGLDGCMQTSRAAAERQHVEVGATVHLSHRRESPTVECESVFPCAQADFSGDGGGAAHRHLGVSCGAHDRAARPRTHRRAAAERNSHLGADRNIRPDCSHAGSGATRDGSRHRDGRIAFAGMMHEDPVARRCGNISRRRYRYVGCATGGRKNSTGRSLDVRRSDFQHCADCRGMNADSGGHDIAVRHDGNRPLATGNRPYSGAAASYRRHCERQISRPGNQPVNSHARGGSSCRHSTQGRDVHVSRAAAHCPDAGDAAFNCGSRGYGQTSAARIRHKAVNPDSARARA